MIRLVPALLLLAAGSLLAMPSLGETARGFVFHDSDADGVRDPDEPGLPGVLVSDGRRVAVTDADGGWQIDFQAVADSVYLERERLGEDLDAHGIFPFWLSVCEAAALLPAVDRRWFAP